MKKIIPLILVVVIVVFGVIYGPKLIHKCDDCGETFFGTGYEPNIVSDILSEEEQIICESCAEEQHAAAIAFGKSLEDFKRELS